MLKEYFSKLKGMLFEPKDTIKSLKKEKDFIKPLEFMAITYLIVLIIFLLYPFIAGMDINVSLIIKTVLIILIYPVLVFMNSGLFHLFIKIFGGVKPYCQTFKAFAYVTAISIIGALLTLILLFVKFLPGNIIKLILAIWGLYLLASSLKQYTELKDSKLLWVFIISFGIEIFLVLIIGFLIMFLNPGLLS